QDAGRPRRRVQHREHGGEHRGAVVHRLGIRRHAVPEPPALRAVVAAQFREELEDPDAHCPLAAGLPGGPVGGVSGVHGAAAHGRARQVPVLPRRGTLGTAAAQPAPVVGRRPRLAGSVPETGTSGGSASMNRESFLTTLGRNALLAALLGLVLFAALPRGDGVLWDYFDVFTLAFCFTLVGHYIEVLLLRLPGIDTGAGRFVRLAGWFAGGLWCYVIGRWLWIQYRRDLADLDRQPDVHGGPAGVGERQLHRHGRRPGTREVHPGDLLAR